MGPDFIAPMAVAVVAIVFGTWAFVSVTKLVLNFFSDKNADRTTASSLTSSELARIVQEAVEMSVRPLEEKIERLERQQRLNPAPGRLREPAQLAEHDLAGASHRPD